MASNLRNLSKAAASRVLASKESEESKAKKRVSDFWSDCDSEGNDPPKTGVYVDPTQFDDSQIAPPRSNDPIKLPFFKPRERPRLRDNFASKISYEDWIEEDADAVGQSGGDNQRADAAKSRALVEKLEADSDFPVGRVYFWRSFCPRCSTNYYPHVPGAWSCVRCKDDGDVKTWQQPSDPESRNCAVCKCEVAAMFSVGGRRIRNPIALNAHMCKRCGRTVCDNCYSPLEADLTEWGFAKKQHICTRCISDLEVLEKPPEEEDLGTLHDEIEGGTDDQAQHVPFWAPKCTSCNVTFGTPPAQWLCTRCGRPVWQPKDAPESSKCWICSTKDPKVRCHKCGQLACNTCGSYGQPLPDMGWYQGNFLSVCRACYGGVASRKQVEGSGVFANSTAVSIADAGGAEGGVIPFHPTCSACKRPQGSIPSQWKSSCHGRQAWQVPNESGKTVCAVCDAPIQDDTSDNCRRCGRLCCVACTQYREPVPDRGYEKGKAQTVCRGCFGAHHLYELDATDLEYWPPRCVVCKRNYPKPPDRWRCPNQCGNLAWQPIEHVMSKCCWSCGKAVSSGVVNCRKCGRLVCKSCVGRAEVVVRGFTKGVEYPVCFRCFPPKTKEAIEAEKKKLEEEEKKKKLEEEEKKKKREAAAAAKPLSPARGKTPAGKRAGTPAKPGAAGAAAAGASGHGRQGSPTKPGASAPAAKPGGKTGAAGVAAAAPAAKPGAKGSSPPRSSNSKSPGAANPQRQGSPSPGGQKGPAAAPGGKPGGKPSPKPTPKK